MTSTHAVGLFGPVTTILRPGCRFDSASGDCAVDDQGVVGAFVAFSGGSCGREPYIHFAGGGGATWDSLRTPYRGAVLGMGIDGTRALVLFSNDHGVHIGELAHGQFSPSETVSKHSLADWGPGGGGEAGGGSLVAKGGKWWAVWSERARGGEPFQMFQASTMTSGGELLRERIASTVPGVLQEAVPSLTLDPADPGGAALAWMVVLDGSWSMVRFARAGIADAAWQEQAWVPPAPQPGRNVGGPVLFASDGSLHGVYGDDDTITYTLDPPDETITTRFRAQGNGARVSHSAGRTFVAWNNNDQHVVVGEPPGTGSERVKFSPSGAEQLIGVAAGAGKATVLAVTFADHALCARAQA